MRDGAIADAIWLYSALIAARANHKLELARGEAIHMRWAVFEALPACIRHQSERVRDVAIHMLWAKGGRIQGYLQH